MSDNKLNPTQIGILASAIKRAIDESPKLPIPTDGVMPQEVDPEQLTEMEPWEKMLQHILNEEMPQYAIPTYEEIQIHHLDILETLIEYYSIEY